jgi:hypothetical protein
MKINFRKTIILFKLSALSLFFQACEKDTHSENYSTNRPTATGKATSINFSGHSPFKHIVKLVKTVI